MNGEIQETLKKMDEVNVPPANGNPAKYPSLRRTRALIQIAADIVDMLSTKTENRAEAQYIATLVKNAVEWQ